MSTEPQPIDGLPSYAELRTRTDAPAGSNWFLFGRDDQIGTLNLLRKGFSHLAAKFQMCVFRPESTLNAKRICIPLE